MSKANEFKKWFSERMGHSDPLKLAKEAIEELECELKILKSCSGKLAFSLQRIGGTYDIADDMRKEMNNAIDDFLEIQGDSDIVIDSLERDAKRYRFLRQADVHSINNGGIFAGKTPDNVVLNGVDLDDAIDAAMGESKDEK
ncbi:hypothetical protein [Sessilibacter corallicola]|uniref:hypothetical protein n=1 Tax=Sessilibacter corallicola TaxID=2904075 RepID=UPI001E5E5055|nr:hypothetical protein [Sessilibacter corallicola]MCE2029262.1 hypothetical protein [Sessilibacter corallicola]